MFAIVLSIIGLAISVAAAAVALVQTREARNANAVNVLMPFFNSWHEPASKDIRRRLYRGDLSCHEMSQSEESAVRLQLDRLEMLGSFVVNHVVNFHMVRTMFWQGPARLWPAVSDFVLDQRKNGAPDYGRNYQRLVDMYSADPRPPAE